MANEITVRVSLNVAKGGTQFRSVPTAYAATMSGVGGPTPGSINVTTDGVDVNLSALTEPGHVTMVNQEAVGGNYVEWGLKEVGGQFTPIGILRPGRPSVWEFSPNLLEEYSGTGTGTDAATHTLHLKANTAACKVFVGAFEA